MIIIKENCEEVRVEELQLLSWKAKGFHILSMYFCICVLRIPHLENDNTNNLFVKYNREILIVNSFIVSSKLYLINCMSLFVRLIEFR